MHVICTYNRERLVESTMKSFSDFDCPGYRMVVVNNGDAITSCSDKIEIVDSVNMGGSSGFTRGMIYALDTGATHVVLNDDDAKVEPESMFRLIAFLRLVKNPEVCVAGIMFDESNPDIVYESGAMVVNGRLEPLNRGLDINDVPRLHELMDGSPMYCNWTLFCAPCSLLKDKGLSLPLFIREDDIEFGLRCNAEMITLPGFHVWHHTYPKRYSPTEHYYYARNRLVALCSSSYTDLHFIDDLLYEIIVDTAAYRYECAEAMLEGIEDFLRGPEYVFSLCKCGMKRFDVPPRKDLDSLREETKTVDHLPKSSRLVRRITFNGIILPSAGNIEADPSDVNLEHFYRAGKVIYRTGGGEGITKSREVAHIASISAKIVKLRIITWFRFSKIRDEYIRYRERYSSEEFWRELLEFS